MIETPDITTPSSDVMFEHDGNKFTLAQVQEAADKTGVSLEEYVSKYNINKVKATENIPVKPVENKEEKPPKNKKQTGDRYISWSPMTAMGMGVDSRSYKLEEKQRAEDKIEAQNTYDEIQKELKTLNPEYINSTFGNNYFDLANIPSEWVPSNSPGTQSYGYSRRMPIEEYLSPEKYKQYQQYLNGGVEAIEPIDEENEKYIQDLLSESTKQVRNQKAQDLVNDVPDHIRRIMPNSAGEFKDVNEADESLKLIANGITFQKEEYTKNLIKYEEQEKKWVDSVEKVGKQIDDLTNEYGKIDPNSPPEVIEKYNNLVTSYDQQIQQYEALGLNKLYNDLILESENINSSIDDLTNKLKSDEYDLGNRKVLEDALKLDYTWSTRVGMAMEDFIAGGLVNTALLTAQATVAAARDLRKLTPVPKRTLLNLPPSTINAYDDTVYNNTIGYLQD